MPSRLRLCPMCESDQYNVRLSITRANLNYAIVDCKTCGFTYVPQLHNATYGEQEQVPSAPPRKSRYLHIKKLSDRLLHSYRKSRQAAVLEIGAGWGGLANVFSADRTYCYLGFEPSIQRADFCKRFKFNVHPELFDSKKYQNKFNLVILDNVIEHVEHPRQLIRAAVESLVSNGILIIIVPNVMDVRQLIPSWRSRHHWQPHCHINYFSPSSLKKLFAEHDIENLYFGWSSLKECRDLSILPRVLADKLGIHFFGLNCYGIKK
jgi:SAM-dependent methyltransferase